MEMCIAFYLHKQIYILFDVPEDSQFLDEILAMEPVNLRGELLNIINA